MKHLVLFCLFLKRRTLWLPVCFLRGPLLGRKNFLFEGKFFLFLSKHILTREEKKNNLSAASLAGLAIPFFRVGLYWDERKRNNWSAASLASVAIPLFGKDPYWQGRKRNHLGVFSLASGVISLKLNRMHMKDFASVFKEILFVQVQSGLLAIKTLKTDLLKRSICFHCGQILQGAKYFP